MKKKGLTDLVLNKSNSNVDTSNQAAMRSSMTNRDREQSENVNRIPALNIGVVTK